MKLANSLNADIFASITSRDFNWLRSWFSFIHNAKIIKCAGKRRYGINASGNNENVM